jgi:hypothetical protein
VSLPALALALALQATAGRLEEARIRVELRDPETAEVSARYRILEPADSVRFNLIRLAGQALRFEQPVSRPGFRWDTLPGLYRASAAARERSLDLEFRYQVQGDLARIPLPVPEAPALPAVTPVRLTVSGLPPGREARFRFPRFQRDPRGSWQARPDHVPGFIAIVQPEGGWPVPAVAQWSVVLVALGGTAAWLWVQLARRRSP